MYKKFGFICVLKWRSIDRVNVILEMQVPVYSLTVSNVAHF